MIPPSWLHSRLMSAPHNMLTSSMVPWETAGRNVESSMNPKETHLEDASPDTCCLLLWLPLGPGKSLL